MKIPECVNRAIPQNSSEFLLMKVPQQTKKVVQMFKVDKKGMCQECFWGVFMIRLENISEVYGGV